MVSIRNRGRNRGGHAVQRLRIACYLVTALGLLALAACQPPTVVVPTPAPTARPAASSTPAPVAVVNPTPTTAPAAPSPVVTRAALPPTQPASTNPPPTQAPPTALPPTSLPPTAIPPTPTPSLPFGLEQAHLLAPTLGTANKFGRLRMPADPTTFTADNTVRTDPGAFRGSRELVDQALEQGLVAFVLEIDPTDSPAVVARRAQSLATMHPTARPWLIIIGNELNLWRMQDYPIETYYAQLRAAYDAVKAVAPTVNISTDGQNYWEGAPFEHPMADPNASNRVRALLRVFERDQWTPDYITVHIFDSVWAPGQQEVYSLVGRTRFYNDILAGYRLPRRPGLFVGEFGLPVADPVPSAQAGKYWRFFITEREQADLAFQAAVWSTATGTPLNYFGGVDTPREGLRRNERGEIVEGVYGLVSRDDNRPRPAFAAYSRAQELLRGATGQIAADGLAGVGGACFQLAEGGQMCVAQATTGRGGRFATNPLPSGVRFRVEDVLGNPIGNAARQGGDGRITLDLPPAPAQKTGGPVRVLFIEG